MKRNIFPLFPIKYVIKNKGLREILTKRTAETGSRGVTSLLVQPPLFGDSFTSPLVQNLNQWQKRRGLHPPSSASEQRQRRCTGSSFGGCYREQRSTTGRRVWNLSPWLPGTVSAEHIFRTPQLRLLAAPPLCNPHSPLSVCSFEMRSDVSARHALHN